MSEKAKEKALEYLDEKEHDICTLGKNKEENKSSNDDQKFYLTKQMWGHSKVIFIFAWEI